MAHRVFVAGGGGFLGTNVTKVLAARGIPHVAVSRRDGVDFLDLARTVDLMRSSGCDALINCAAYIGGLEFVRQHVAEVFFQNSLLSLHLMEAARRAGVQLFVNTLANCSYPAQAHELREDQWWDGPLHDSVLAYGSTKKMSWVQSWAYRQQYGFNTINLLLPNMYGPHDYFDRVRSHALGALVTKFVDAHESGLPTVDVWGDGTPIREWLYVEDAADVCVRALDMSPGIDPINIGVGKGISIRHLAELIQRLVGYEGEIVFDTSKPNGAPAKIMNVERMRALLHWEPRTRLEDGVRSTIDWYRQQRRVAPAEGGSPRGGPYVRTGS
jgi:GDP-L-fucose synthase